MGNQKKSSCQLRLEARASKQQQAAPSPPTSAASAEQQLAAQMHSRIARATEVRVSQQRARETSARARVLHAQQVAREQRVKRREQKARVCLASRRKIEVARERRRAQLAQTQQSCKSRVAFVREKVQSVKAEQKQRCESALSLLQQQLRDAEERREAQTQRMVRRLSQRWQSVESVKDRVARVKFIQRWYRRHVDARKTAASLRAVAAHVARVVECWQRVAATGFEESMQLLQDRELARAAQSVLRVLLPSAAVPPPTGTRSPRGAGASFRVVLLAGMIAYHPDEIMESGQCSRLAFAAHAMVKDLSRIYVLLASGTARDLKTGVARLEAHFAFYFASFSRWKNRDAERLAAEMLSSYHDIYVLKQRYVATQETALEGDGARELAVQTEKQLNQLKSALAHVLGKDDASARVQAVERSVEQQQQDEQMAEGDDHNDTGHNDSEPATEAESEAEVAATESGAEAAPPALFETFLSDEKLVHELILDPSFKLPQPLEDRGDSDASELATRIRDSMQKAFWDQVIEANDVTVLIARTDELRGQFARIIAMRPELVASVNDALESSELRALLQHPEAHFVDLQRRCERVVLAILQAEAPVRNDTTHAFLREFEATVTRLLNSSSATGPAAPSVAIRILVDFLAFAFEKVETIRVDLVNAHVGMLGAYLQRHGVAYEQQKMRELLAAGARFERTHQWLTEEFAAYWASLDLDEKDRMARYESLAFAKFLRRSVVSLATKYIADDTSVWPDTFDMDVDRIFGFRNTMDRVTVISTLLVVVHEYTARRRLAVPRDFFGRVSRQLSELLLSEDISGTHIVDQAVEAVRQLEAQRSASTNEYNDDLNALEEHLHSAFGPENPVFKLFEGRVASSLFNAQFCEPSEVEVHRSLAPFDAEVRAVAQGIKRLAKHNESVYAPIYNSIVKELVTASAAN